MSVQSHLSATASNLILTNVEDSSIDTSITTLQDRLRAYFSTNLLAHFMFGSYTRNTILPRKVDSDSDVDYMLVFDNSDGKKPQSFLDRVKKFAEIKYSTSEIYQSYPTIVLELNHIKFELVPAYKPYSFSSDYCIPNKGYSSDDWINTNPTSLKNDLTNKNTNNGLLIKPLARLLKYWNVNQGKIYSSYAIEKFVIDNTFLYTSNIKTIFFEAITDLYNRRWDLPNYKQVKVETAKSIIDKTKEYENDNMPYSAEAEIKKLIPEYKG